MESSSKHKNVFRKGPTVPSGSLAINDKWHDTSLGKELKNQKAGYFCDGLGIIDFFISETSPVLYIPQSELMVDGYKSKLMDLLGAYAESAVVIAERNTTTIDSYNSLVAFAALELDLHVIPIGNQSELPQLLIEMAHQEVKDPSSNPFLRLSKPDLTKLQMSMVNLIPGVGEKKAQLLLNKIGPIERISNASVESMTAVVGDVAAKSVWNFFHEKIRINN